MAERYASKYPLISSKKYFLLIIFFSFFFNLYSFQLNVGYIKEYFRFSLVCEWLLSKLIKNKEARNYINQQELDIGILIVGYCGMQLGHLLLKCVYVSAVCMCFKWRGTSSILKQRCKLFPISVSLHHLSVI